VIAALCGCERGATPEAAQGAATSEVAFTPVGAPDAANPYGADFAGLRVEGRGDDETLVASNDGSFVRVGEFNAWLGTYPLQVTGGDLASSRRQALEQMVTFKLLVAQARAAGYEERLGKASEPRSLAIAYLRDQVTDVASISDEAARKYEAEHPELFAQLGGDEVPAEARMMAIKGSIRGGQLWERVQEWMAEAGIRYQEGALQ
jgi:hypothetical protein